MKDIDIFATELFEEAKRFLEKAKEDEGEVGKKAFLHAALLLGISSLEAHLNAISDEMAERPGLGILELSILSERQYSFEKGKFKLTKKLKIYNLIDRIEFIVSRFALPGKRLDTNADWWCKLNQGIDMRNSLVHPKEKHVVTYQHVKHAFEGILGVLDAIYMALYEQHFPALGRRFDSSMDF
ncbi:MAG: hypothetical protein WCE90_12720 [Candidatus Zixiibacteriota bacterium]